ncbi:MFS transporter [Echinicola sp. 20G]|uniref:MFS transporter n=1 Tax=Echinicola sp. 20G TaxID=2781961 RepID=UPI00190FE9DC|nr:MFS transporter [Echinicola sp. 20G]
MNLDRKKVHFAWAMYDWANSVYSLVITSTIFPVYYNSVTKSVSGSDIVSFFGFDIVNTVLYSWSISFSFLVIAILSPLLSGMADYGGKKLLFMEIFALLGSISCIGLFFFDGTNLEFGIICSVLASVGYAGSIVFYNAFLPEISNSDEYDMLSAKGFALGYIGSVILLIINLVMIQKPEFFGIEDGGVAARWSFLMTGVWWAGFALIPFNVLPRKSKKNDKEVSLLWAGYKEINTVFKELRRKPDMKRFLLSFLFYSMGVQTVMYMAASFGDKELALEGDKLIITILIIQVVAILGSYFFAWVSKLRGNKVSLMSMVIIWVGICLAAYFVTTEMEFYALAFVVGLVMGGIQAISRSSYSKLIPVGTNDTASYFSFYDVTEKLGIVFGTFSYGFIEQFTGSMRVSSLVLGIFFVLGMMFLLRVRFPGYKLVNT